MSPLNLSDFNRGANAIKEAAKGSGRKGGFAPQISWEVGEEKFVKFLLPIEESPTVSIHEWIDCGERDNGKTDWGFFLARTDPVLGEDHDPLTAKGSTPRKRVMSAAVELEAVTEVVGKRNKPVGFSVLTSEYERKTDDGTETVTQPGVGYISQASANFFQILVAHDENGEFDGTVFRVKRTDDKTYMFTPIFDVPVDYTNLVEHVEGVSYLSRNEEVWDELEPALANAENDEERAHLIGVALLERRLNELADYEEYTRKTGHIEKIESKFGNEGNKGKSRPARQSQRQQSGKTEKTEKSSGSRARFEELKKLANKD